jgi:stage II sporulation protein GA (sporulation sigma-E factor processing peptidase)
MEYYVEYVFAENFFIDFILLYITGNLLKRNIIYKRLAAASAIGALYVIIAVYAGMGFTASVAVKFSISVLMLAVAYDIRGKIANARLIICFYTVTLIMVGIIYGLYCLEFDEFSVNMTMFSMFIGFAALKMFFKETKHAMDKQDYMRTITITLNEKTKTIKAFIDTGNELCEPMTGKPVVVVSMGCISELIGEEASKEIKKFYLSGSENYHNLFLEENNNLKLRAIKYNTISCKGKTMICVVPDNVTITCSNSIISADAVIGIYPQEISENEDYEALLFKKLLDWECEKENENIQFCNKIYTENI